MRNCILALVTAIALATFATTASAQGWGHHHGGYGGFHGHYGYPGYYAGYRGPGIYLGLGAGTAGYGAYGPGYGYGYAPSYGYAPGYPAYAPGVPAYSPGVYGGVGVY